MQLLLCMDHAPTLKLSRSFMQQSAYIGAMDVDSDEKEDESTVVMYHV